MFFTLAYRFWYELFHDNSIFTECQIFSCSQALDVVDEYLLK